MTLARIQIYIDAATRLLRDIDETNAELAKITKEVSNETGCSEEVLMTAVTNLYNSQPKPKSLTILEILAL